MKRTLLHMMSSLQRKLDPSEITLGEIAEAIQMARKDIDTKYDWPWAYGDTNLLILPPYTTGTISMSTGDATVTGSGTSFTAAGVDSTWRLRAAGRSGDWKVATVTNPTTLELQQLPNFDGTISGSTYVLWKDEYATPSDFQVGGQLLLYNQEIRCEIPYITMSDLERITMGWKTAQSTLPLGYSDVGTGVIRFAPPIASRAELRLRYKKIPADLAELSAVSSIPEGYDELLELVAGTKLRQDHGLLDKNSSGQTATKMKALIRDLATVDMRFDGPGPGMADSSISQGGLSILPGA